MSPMRNSVDATLSNYNCAANGTHSSSFRKGFNTLIVLPKSVFHFSSPKSLGSGCSKITSEFTTGHGQILDLGPDLGPALDRALDAALDAAFDLAFDPAFDLAFDPAFDPALDAAF